MDQELYEELLNLREEIDTLNRVLADTENTAKQFEDAYLTAFDEGYTRGFEQGYEQGYNKGHAAGFFNQGEP